MDMELTNVLQKAAFDLDMSSESTKGEKNDFALVDGRSHDS
jgi:hypothetical protein